MPKTVTSAGFYQRLCFCGFAEAVSRFYHSCMPRIIAVCEAAGIARENASAGAASRIIFDSVW